MSEFGYGNGMAVVALVATLVMSAVSLGVSVIVAIYVNKRWGDVAGARLILEAQAEDRKRARVAALQSLVNEVVRIRRLTKYYIESPGRSVPEMPVAAFETAFVSGSPGLAAGEELVRAVSEYLVRADQINSLIEMYLHSLNKGVQQGAIMSACRQLPEVLDQLDECLQRELEAL